MKEFKFRLQVDYSTIQKWETTNIDEGLRWQVWSALAGVDEDVCEIRVPVLEVMDDPGIRDDD